ncbi:MAG: SMI1/KNR4 family protein [Roseobacter sp.]
MYATRYASEFGEPKGCSKRDVEILEQDLERRLPGAYREFLLWMGNDKHGRLKGSDWFLTDVRENTAVLPELLFENAISIDQLKNQFCFFMHQGYMAAWFDLSQSVGDPKCFFFSEANNGRKIEGPKKFTEFLKEELGL